MNSLRKFTLTLSIVLCSIPAFADTNGLLPLDLKAFVGKSQFTRLNIDWMLPRGPQVADAVPFQIDGIIELYGKSALQADLDIRTNVNGIAVGRSFDELHLLCCTTGGSPTGKTSVATIRLNYTDGSSNDLSLIFGTNIRQWWGPRHEEDSELVDKHAIAAWSMEIADAARADKRSRFFHTTLTNPSPDKVVKSIDLESTKSIAGALIAAMTVGPKDARTTAPSTLPNIPPDPQNLVRKGEPTSLAGKIFDQSGRPIADAPVSILSVRSVGGGDDITDDPAVGMKIKTGPDGSFRFDQLPDDKMYRLLVLVEGYAPYNFFNVDPKRGPVQMRLHPGEPLKAKGKYFAHGQVVDGDGKPVVGATIEPRGVAFGEGVRSWGGNQGFQDFVVSDANGEFIMERKEPFTEVQVTIDAARLARKMLWLDATNAVEVIKLGVGCELSGRVLKDGKPVAKFRMSVSGENRSSDVYAGDFHAITDNDGRFTFRNLQPNTAWNLHGDIKSHLHGSLGNRAVSTGGHGERIDVGDLNIEPGIVLAGKVVAANGEPLPKGLALMLSYSTGGSVQVPIDQEGAFEATGLYPGQLSIYVQPNDWTPTGANRSLDDLNPWSLIGQLEQSKTNLLIVVEKKARNYNSSNWNGNGQLPQQDYAHSRALAGAEDASGLIRFSGTVLNDQTGERIQRFTITPGRKPPPMGRVVKALTQRIVESVRGKSVPPHERPFWSYARAATFTNGTFSLGMMPLTSTPMLRVEAEGFLPYESEPMPTSNTNLVIRLEKGNGPAGVVVCHDGKPAIGASIIFAKTHQQFSLHGTTLSVFSEKEQLRTTTNDGRFSFPPLPGGRNLFVSHTNGWANLRMTDFSNRDKIELQPWAKVTGTLVDKNGKPVPNEKLALSMNYDWNSGDPFVNLQERPTTDAKGRFQFLLVPPQDLQLIRLVPNGRLGGMTHVLQTHFVAEPGKTTDLGNVTLDSPPPPSAFDQLKKKIGL